MTKPAEQSLTHQIIDEINGLIATKRANPFLLQGIEFKAKKLASSKRGDYEAILGIINSIRKDYPAMRKHFDAAVEYGCVDMDAEHSYAVALSANDFYTEAVDVLRPFVKGRPDDATLQTDYLKRLLAGARFQEAHQVYQHLGALNARAHAEFARTGKALSRIAEFLSDQEISDDQLSAAANVLGAYFREKKLHATTFSMNFVEGLGELPCHINHIVYVSESSERVCEAESEVDMYMADVLLDTKLSDVVAFHIVSEEDNAAYSTEDDGEGVGDFGGDQRDADNS